MSFKMKEETKKQNDEGQENFKSKYGFLPTSTWYIPVKDSRLQLFCADKVGEGTMYKKGSGLSQFHPDLAKRIIEYWSEEGDRILDPFGGRVRALIARNCKRNYVGYEISKKAYNYLVEKLKTQKTFTGESSVKIEIRNQDSRKIDFKNEFDMVFSCPPYWNVEDYNELYGEKIAGQLSDIGLYSRFMEELEEIVKKCFTALKPNKYAVFVVNDFRRDGRFYAFHKDTIQIFLNAGFILHDIIINKLKTNVPLKTPLFLSMKCMVKEHEYVLVFKKPERIMTKLI